MALLGFRASAPLVLAIACRVVASGGTSAPAGSTGMAATTTTTTVTNTRGFPCQGDRRFFDAGFGDCANYMQGLGPNYYYCDEDSAGNFTAHQVCSECRLCVAEEVVPASQCLGDASSFDIGHGGCGSYARKFNYIWAFCHKDADNVTGLFADQVCSECGLCYLVPPSEDLGPSSAAVAGALLLLLFLGASAGAVMLWSRQRRLAGNSNSGTNVVVDNNGSPAASGLADPRRVERDVERDVDQGLRGSMDSIVEPGVADAEQSNQVELGSEIAPRNDFLGTAMNKSIV